MGWPIGRVKDDPSRGTPVESLAGMDQYVVHTLPLATFGSLSDCPMTASLAKWRVEISMMRDRFIQYFINEDNTDH